MKLTSGVRVLRPHIRSATFTPMDTSKSIPNLQGYAEPFVDDIKSSAMDLDWAIGLNRKLLKIFGLWLYPKETQWQTIRSNILVLFFIFGMLAFQIIPQTLALIKVWPNMTLIVDNCVTNIPVITCELKMIIPWFYKKGKISIY